MSFQNDEIFDLVDMEDNIIGQASRKEIHEKSLLHRSVHVFVFNTKGHLFLQKRAFTKDENPGLWDSSAAGHVNSGESYTTSAHRELKEELGISGNLELFFRLTACADTLWEHVMAYICLTNCPIILNREEIYEGYFWPISKIEDNMKNNSSQFTSVFIILFRQYLLSLSKNKIDKLTSDHHVQI